MSFDLTEAEAAAVVDAAESILKIISFAQGRAESYKARRDEFRLVKFPGMKEEAETVFLEFTQKELSKMPKSFRKEFRLQGGIVPHVRKKENGTYEIRYRRNGLNLSVSAKSLEVAKERFIEKLCACQNERGRPDVTFKQYSEQWLEIVKRPHVKEDTLHNYKRMLCLYVYDRIGGMRLKEIRPLEVQKLLNEILERGLERSATNVYVIMKAVFEFAVAEDLIEKSPMRLIQKPKHEMKHGVALTIEEERAFVDACAKGSSPYRFAYLLLLFTGIRRSELASAEISSDWVTVVTSKTRKGAGVKKRKIPVSPMLRPFLSCMTKENLSRSPEKLTKGIAAFLPGHHLHDLRHTFITRCQEKGISRELTSLWAGHRADNTVTSNVYTHLSESFQLEEIKKLHY